MNEMTEFLNNPAISSESGGRTDPPGSQAPDDLTGHLPTMTITQSPPPGVLIADHFHQNAEYRTYRPDGTRDYLITLTLNGCGTYRIGDEVRLCRRGDVMVLTPGTPHRYGTSSEAGYWEFVWCHFLPHEDWQPYLALPAALPGLLHVQLAQPAVFDRALQAFRRLIGDQLHTDPLHERMAYLALEEIVLLLAMQGGEAQGSLSLDPRIEEVKRLLLEQMQEPHTIQSLAEQVRLSPSRLSHLFKEATGMSIIGMLHHIRLRQGARLLAYTSRPVGEIAEAVGFQSPFYFTKQFSAVFGISPSAYRRAAQSLHAGDGTSSGTKPGTSPSGL